MSNNPYILILNTTRDGSPVCQMQLGFRSEELLKTACAHIVEEIERFNKAGGTFFENKPFLITDNLGIHLIFPRDILTYSAISQTALMLQQQQPGMFGR